MCLQKEFQLIGNIVSVFFKRLPYWINARTPLITTIIGHCLQNEQHILSLYHRHIHTISEIKVKKKRRTYKRERKTKQFFLKKKNIKATTRV
jgi:hypothetical protein